MIMFEINSTDHKSISACIFSDEGFREEICELVESERDNERVAAEFLRDNEQTPSGIVVCIISS